MPQAMIPYFIGELAVGIVGTALLFAFKNSKPIVKIIIYSAMFVLFAVLTYLMFGVLKNQ